MSTEPSINGETVVNEGRNWSRYTQDSFFNFQGQARELAAEAYAAWGLGYLDPNPDPYGISQTIENIIRLKIGL